MARSVWKPIYQQRHVVAQLKEMEPKIWSRASLITANFLGRKVLVHNGKTFVAFRVTAEKLGHRFGEYACTKRIGRHIHKPREKGGAGKKSAGRAGK